MNLNDVAKRRRMGAASPLEGVTATLRANCLSLTQCDEYNIEE